MPGLGFLKKKRTKEGHGDHHQQTTSPTSPTAPHSAGTTHGSANRNASLSSFPLPPTTTPHGAAGSPPGSKGDSNTSTGQQPQDTHMANLAPQPVQPPPHQAAPPAHDPQSISSINNLMNPAQQQQQESTQHQPQQNAAPLEAPQQYLANPAARSAQTVSPGTDPVKLAQAQAQAGMPDISQAAAAAALPGTQGQTVEQGDQAAMSKPAPGGATIIDPAAQQPVGQIRITKGKYSLPDFEILRTLGTGSFGRVHLVQSRHNTRFYAIKVLKKAQVVKMKQVEHTNDERRMLAEVKHPFLVTLWGTFQDCKNLYMVMDFVEGGELFSLLRKSGVSRPRGPPLQTRNRRPVGAEANDTTAIPQPGG